MARRKQNKKNRSRRANKNSRDGRKKDYGVPNTSGVFVQPRPMDGIIGSPPMEKPKKENKLTQLPPGRGKRFIEHISTFQTRLQSYWSKIYINSDEAYQQSKNNASAMRHDPVIMHPLRQRQLATALLEGHVLPENANDPIQKAVAEELQVMLNRTPYFTKLKLVWLEALWFGKYGTNMVYNFDVQERTGLDGKRKIDTVMRLRDWIPVHGDKIRHEHESGRIGIMTSRVGWLDQGLDRYQGGIRVSDESRVQMVPLSDAWRQAFVVHKHEVEDGNFYDGRSAGMIHGVGLRTRVYWPWWFKQKLLQWVMEFAERFALGIQLWYYEAGNPESEKQVRLSAEEFSNENIIIFPRPIGEEGQGAGYERIEPGMGGTQFFKELLDDYFGKQIKLMIIGQELTSDTASTGLGSGVAKEHRNTFQQIIRFDAQNLAETITNEYLQVLAEYNYPGISWKPRYEFVLEEIDSKRVMESIQMYLEMGGVVSDDEARSVAGLKKPEKGEKVLGQAPNMNGNGQNMVPNQAPPQPPEQIQEQIPRNGQNAVGSRDGMPSGDGQPLQGGRFGVNQPVSFSKIWEQNGHPSPILNQEARSQLLQAAYTRAESLGIRRHRIVDIVLVPSTEEVEVVVIVDPGKGNPGRYQKWITIGGHPGPEGQHEEGTKIQIGPQGKIEKGPKNLEGKDIDVVDKDVAGTEKDERIKSELELKKETQSEILKKKSEQIQTRINVPIDADDLIGDDKLDQMAEKEENVTVDDNSRRRQLDKYGNPDELKETLQQYTHGDFVLKGKRLKGFDSIVLNKKLRDNEQLSLEESQISERLDDAINIANGLPEGIKTYRGIEMDLEKSSQMVDYFQKLKDGKKEISFREYLSTSYNPMVADEFANRTGGLIAGIILEIKPKNGLLATGFSKHDESEIMMSRNSKFKVAKITDRVVYHTGDPEESESLIPSLAGRTVITLEEV